MEMNELFNLARHCLHLCTSNNIEEVIFSYLSETEVDSFVTARKEFWEKTFLEHQINCHIKGPRAVNPRERIVVDGSSLGKNWSFWEEKWKQQPSIVCIYDVGSLDPNLVKKLVTAHDKMILSINNIRMISDKNIEKEIENLNPELVENLVKKELKTIILSLLLSRPLCGADLVKIVYQRFKVFVSPGMLYPTLHELEKKGLLAYEYKFKNKIYSIKEKIKAESILKEHAKANILLSHVLVSD